jgi:hypothetical protein
MQSDDIIPEYNPSQTGDDVSDGDVKAEESEVTLDNIDAKAAEMCAMTGDGGDVRTKRIVETIRSVLSDARPIRIHPVRVWCKQFKCPSALITHFIAEFDKTQRQWRLRLACTPQGKFSTTYTFALPDGPTTRTLSFDMDGEGPMLIEDVAEFFELSTRRGAGNGVKDEFTPRCKPGALEALLSKSQDGATLTGADAKEIVLCPKEKYLPRMLGSINVTTIREPRTRPTLRALSIFLSHNVLGGVNTMTTNDVAKVARCDKHTVTVAVRIASTDSVDPLKRTHWREKKRSHEDAPEPPKIKQLKREDDDEDEESYEINESVGTSIHWHLQTMKHGQPSNKSARSDAISQLIDSLAVLSGIPDAANAMENNPAAVLDGIRKTMEAVRVARAGLFRELDDDMEAERKAIAKSEQIQKIAALLRK